MSEQAVTRYLKCCDGPVFANGHEHAETCPSIVRSALSWIEDTAHGERIRKRGLAAFEAILAERDQLPAPSTAGPPSP